MYELRFSHAQQKPILLVTSGAHTIPFDIAGMRVIIYDEANLTDSIHRLAAAMREAIASPDKFLLASAVEQRRAKPSGFISYCDVDREYLNRLLVHFKPLENAGRSDLWADTRLRVGDQMRISGIFNAVNDPVRALALLSREELGDALCSIAMKSSGG
jgi:hypothetical protein